MCDQISDAVLDAHLRQDPDCKVRLVFALLENFWFFIAISFCRLHVSPWPRRGWSWSLERSHPRPRSTTRVSSGIPSSILATTIAAKVSFYFEFISFYFIFSSICIQWHLPLSQRCSELVNYMVWQIEFELRNFWNGWLLRKVLTTRLWTCW